MLSTRGRGDLPDQGEFDACRALLAGALFALRARPEGGASALGDGAPAVAAAWRLGALWQSRGREIGALVDCYATLRRQAMARRAGGAAGPGCDEWPETLSDAVDALLRVSLRAYHRAATLELEHAASRDWLTAVYNRAYLHKRLPDELERAARCRHPLGMMMLDLDGFKAYNDACGHAAGDRALQQVGRVLLRATRPGDVVARYGGDEFVVIMPETGAAGATALAERVAVELLAAQEADGRRQPALTLSYGIAAYPEHAVDGAALLGEADRRLYAMKHARRTARGRPGAPECEAPGLARQIPPSPPPTGPAGRPD